MSQRLEPGEIFHNEIFVLGKYPKSFPPCKTIPRGSQGLKASVGVCLRMWEECRREPGPGDEGGREAVMRWVRQAAWAVADADPPSPTAAPACDDSPRNSWISLLPASGLGLLPEEVTPGPLRD